MSHLLASISLHNLLRPVPNKPRTQIQQGRDSILMDKSGSHTREKFRVTLSGGTGDDLSTSDLEIKR
jgi:hypothetical protein